MPARVGFTKDIACPEIRFNDDNKPWVIHQFSKIFSEYNTPNSKQLEQYTCGKNGLAFLLSDGAKYDVSRHKSFEPNSLIVGIGTEEVGVSIKGSGCVSPIYNTFSINNEIMESNFALHDMPLVISKNKWKISHISTRRPSEIEASKLQDLPISLPSSHVQSEIASLFSCLDAHIASETKTVEQLRVMKSAMLQNMFPREGERVPRVRFEGFTGEWEERKISDLFKITRGLVLAAPLTSDSQTSEMPYPVYSSQTKDKGLMGYYKDYLYEDAITWTTDGANAGTVNYRAGKFYCTNVCGVLLANKIVPNQMLAEALNNVAKKYVSYVGNPKLMNNVMAEIEISLPSDEDERVLISSLLGRLDNLISIHTTKVSKLQQTKTAILQKTLI